MEEVYVVVDVISEVAVGPFEEYLQAMSFRDFAVDETEDPDESSFQIVKVIDPQTWLDYNSISPSMYEEIS